MTFTRQRMFVVTQDGKLYVFRVEEKAPSREEQLFSKVKAAYTGELVFDKPLYVKDMPPLDMISSGVDHVCMLDRKG